jgi:D-amino-acid dehydrogenase
MNKIIVVGAGILGASTAFQLSKSQTEVVIIDRKDKGQATDAAAGIVCPWLSQRRNQAWYQLAKAGARFYPKLIEELKQTGETNTGYAQVGALSLHTDQNKLEKLMERALKRREDAPEIGEIKRLSEEETNSFFPPLNEDYASVHVSGAARVDGRALRDSLLRSAQKNGATMITGDANLMYNTGTKKVTGITIGKEKIFANKVIVCAGAWADQLLQPLGVHFKVHFQKAQIVHLQYQEEDTNDWPVLIPPGDQYVLAFDNRRIVIGATHENIAEFDTRVTAGGLQEVFNKALNIAPGLADSTFTEARTGFRPFTPGFLPVFGPLPNWEGILVANGLGASGLTMGPYLGSELSKLALGQPTELDLSLYSIEKAIED